MNQPHQLSRSAHLARRQLVGRFFAGVCRTFAFLTVVILVVLLADVLRRGLGVLSWQFLNNFPSRIPARAGVKSAVAGSVWLMALTTLIATPIGVAAALYLEEFSRRSRLATFVEVNIANLAGVPSIIYGMLGLSIFVRWMGLGRSVLAGALTMSVLILPVIIIAAREAIRAVPPSLREASLALGATQWQTSWRVVLPSAMPGILTGLILATSRAIGETAPLIMIGALSFVAFVPNSLTSEFTVLPIQIYSWASRPQAAFQNNAAGAIIVLLAVLFMLNSVAIWMRYHFSRRIA